MARNQSQLERPLGKRPYFRVPAINREMVGRVSERFARAMGTGAFLIGITVVVLVWITWNTLAPQNMQFDPRALNFTLLTLLLSLQASYAAPLILLAQNRQDDRDRVKFEQDRQRAEQNLADTEDKLAFARQYYNDAAASVNRLRSTIPWMFVAGMAGVQEREFYQVAR